ncbi:MAG TPA: RNA polymerase sigma factor [Solirubrobacterales bacterium]|nr:RNA polymerase sigma factor [Solirubrobacterales bacterium]
MSSLLSDERLVRRAADSEERAFAAIFDRYHQALYRYCAAIVGDPQDAQDALQNTMLKVLRALPGDAREIKLKPWLYRIAHNESVDLLRRRRDTRELRAELVAPGPPLADDLSSRERLRQLLSDLDELPERQRGALVMRELAGLDFDGIAAALGTSSGGARQTLYEARLSLRQMDEGRGMDCATVTRALSDGDGRVTRRRDVRAHLRACAECRRFRAEIEGREQGFAALAPLPAAAAAGLLQGLLSGGAAGGGSGCAAGAAAAGGAAKAFGSSAALKSAAAVLAIAAIGTSAADRGGLIDLGVFGGGSQPRQPPARSPGAAVSGQAGTAHQPASRRSDSGATETAVKDQLHLHTSKRLPSRAGRAATGDKQANAPAAKTAPTAPAQGNASGHPHGKGHEKQHPVAASHGQETAAAHKEAAHGASAEAHGEPASKPVHPDHPAHPSGGQAQEKGPPGDPAAEAPAAEGTAAEEVPAQGGVGKNPGGTGPDRP